MFADQLKDAATNPADEVLIRLGSRADGLTDGEAVTRLRDVGPNVLRTHRANPWRVLGRQLRSAVLILLFVTAAVALFVGDTTNAIVIAVILCASVGLGFGNEYRAERAADALHSRVSHRVVVVRNGAAREINVVELVPGDVVHLAIGAIVPADIRLLTSKDLMCDESILTGESLPVEKSEEAPSSATSLSDLTSCVFMGTVIQSGSATGVVVATGARAEFGRIALGLGDRQPQT
jgi:Mg2+-importing ATPase